VGTGTDAAGVTTGGTGLTPWATGFTGGTFLKGEGLAGILAEMTVTGRVEAFNGLGVSFLLFLVRTDLEVPRAFFLIAVVPFFRPVPELRRLEGCTEL
jgi:hypothetical protein